MLTRLRAALSGRSGGGDDGEEAPGDDPEELPSDSDPSLDYIEGEEEEEDEEDEDESMAATGDDDDDDDDDGVMEAEPLTEGQRHRLLQLLGRPASSSGPGGPASLPLLPKTWAPLDHDITHELNSGTTPLAGRNPLRKGLLRKREKGLGNKTINPVSYLALRETGSLLAQPYSHTARSGTSKGTRLALSLQRAIPKNPQKIVARRPSRGYCGTFSKDGSLFVAGFQDRDLRVFNVEDGGERFRPLMSVEARLLRWTVTDVDMSQDNRFLIYSSINPVVHLCRVERRDDGTGAPGQGAHRSIANITDVHEALWFRPDEEGRPASNFGIWSVLFAPGGGRILAGTSEPSALLFDLERYKPIVRAVGHQDDVNSVAYPDPESPNVFVTASDDSQIHVYDTRDPGQGGGRGEEGAGPGLTNISPVGYLPGHLEGIAHISARGDGRYVASNGKDQRLKLWDLRRAYTKAQMKKLPPAKVPSVRFDYRWQQYPLAPYALDHPHDASIFTYRGHSVLQTLIRARFSPYASTGGRLLYSGSMEGPIIMYDIQTGHKVAECKYHNEVVRDVSWSPRDPAMVSTSWDGSCVLWSNREAPEGAGRRRLPEPDRDQMTW